MNAAVAYAKIVAKPRRSDARSFTPFTQVTRVTPRIAWLRDYTKVTGLAGVGGELPIAALQVLAGSMHIAMLAHASVPRSALGLVHLRNLFEKHGALPADATWELSASATPVHSSAGKLNGVLIRTEAHTDGALRWSSTIDAVWPERKKGPANGAAKRVQSAPSSDATGATLRVAEDTGRKYARASGDYNPIHLHAASARLFGFSHAIAHGMWTVARTLAAFDTAHITRVEARFRKPLTLPSEVQLLREGASKFWCTTGDRSQVLVEINAH